MMTNGISAMDAPFYALHGMRELRDQLRAGEGFDRYDCGTSNAEDWTYKALALADEIRAILDERNRRAA